MCVQYRRLKMKAENAAADDIITKELKAKAIEPQSSLKRPSAIYEYSFSPHYVVSYKLHCYPVSLDFSGISPD